NYAPTVSWERSTTHTTPFRRDSFSMTPEIVSWERQRCVTNSRTGFTSREGTTMIKARASWNGMPSMVQAHRRSSTEMEPIGATTIFGKIKQQTLMPISWLGVVKTSGGFRLTLPSGVTCGGRSSNAMNKNRANLQWVTFTTCLTEHLAIRVAEAKAT